MEKRIVAFTRDGLSKLSGDISSLKDEIHSVRNLFEERVDGYKSQVLWRIIECEERIRERVARIEVKNMQEA